MSLVDSLKELIPDISTVDEQPITNSLNEIVGWNSYIKTSSGKPLAGGTSSDRMTARRIGIAEAFERALARKISNNSDLRTAFMVDDFPSTCGFAAGFEPEKTKLRAVCEAIERWAWSQWIDFKGILQPAEIGNGEISDLSLFLKQAFEFTQIYAKSITFDYYGEIIEVWFGVFLGFKNNGIYAGSRVAFSKNEIWSHAVIEAYRNLKNCEFYRLNPSAIDPTDVIANRVRYFSENREVALRSIGSANNENWPQPKLVLARQYNTQIDNLYLWRCLAGNYQGWHIGNETRFVY